MLARYHKYKMNRTRVKALNDLSKHYGLKYNAKSIHDFLLLSVFETGLKQKQIFESIFEKVRNDCFDMWEHLSFNERNDLVFHELHSYQKQMIYFNYENEIIYIPFFDVLMNTLYGKEVAILELPQFFNLYYDFKDKIIPIETYGNLPLLVNMSEFPCLAFNDEDVILHDNIGSAFIKVGKETEIYPYLRSVTLNEEQSIDYAKKLLVDPELFIETLVSNEMVSKWFLRRYRILKKRREKHESK